MSELALTVIFWFFMLFGFVVVCNVIEELLGWRTGTGDMRTPWILVPALWALPYVEHPVSWLIFSVIVLLCALVLDLRDLWESFKDWRWRRSHPEEHRKWIEKLAALEGDFEELEPIARANLYVAREAAKQELEGRLRRRPSTREKLIAAGFAVAAAVVIVLTVALR